MLTVFNV